MRVFQFGEQLPEYGVPVLNEREARAGAGILFFVAIVAFMNAWMAGDFSMTKLVVMGFLMDFLIRVFVNPKYAPSLVLGRIAVRNQRPDYVGAPQKRFAWLIGFVLAVAMSYLVVLQNVRGLVNLVICALCLLLLFFESAFGICIGCSIYNLFNREKAQLCPGNACEVQEKSDIQKVGATQVAVVMVFLGLLFGIYHFGFGNSDDIKSQMANSTLEDSAVNNAEAERCKVPEFAIAMGHAEKWKLHNNCK